MNHPSMVQLMGWDGIENTTGTTHVFKRKRVENNDSYYILYINHCGALDKSKDSIT